MAERASKLINDLSKVPNIVAGLGLSVAAAQKAFNLDYLENIEKLVAMAKSIFGGLDDKGAAFDDARKQELEAFRPFLFELLKSCAPSRYQFTETTLAVRLDLAQTMSASGSVGLGVGYAGVSLNASLTVGYRYDYRAAAECRAVLNAIPADPTMMATLLDRAGKLGDKAIELPTLHEVDKNIIDQAAVVFEKVIGAKPQPVKTVEPPKS